MKKKPPGGKPLRAQIAALEIIRALEAYILGEKKMTATQVTAALALLRKRLPDLVRQTLAPAKPRKPPTGKGHEDALKELE